MQPTLKELRRGLRDSRPTLYRALVKAGTLDGILESLQAQAHAIEARAIKEGLAPDQAQELANEAYRGLMEGDD